VGHLSGRFRVEASPERAFDVIADPSRFPEWQTALVEMVEVAGRPGGIGSSFTAIYRVLGRPVESHFVVNAATRPRLFQLTGATAGGWARWTTTIEPEAVGSTIVIDLDYQLPRAALTGLLVWLAGNRVGRDFRRTYDRLKLVLDREGLADREDQSFG